MRIVYAGYRSWAYKIAKGLLKEKNPKYTIVGVLTTEESEANYTSLKTDVFTIDPTNLNSRKNKTLLKKLNPDVFLFYGWSWKIPEEIYSVFPCLILHTSPLPKYRGGSPLQHQILRGETMSAISIFQATEGIDEGPIYGQIAFSLDGSIEDIFKRIVKVGTRETKLVLEGLASKTLKPKAQDESRVTYFRRRKPNESELSVKDFQTKTAVELYNFIRSLGGPYPTAYIRCKDGKKLFIKTVSLSK